MIKLIQIKQQGFTLIELVLFIIVSSLLATTILVALVTATQKIPTIHQDVVATQTAKRCMEWFLGQNTLQGYSNLTCPNTTTPSFCTTPSGYSISTNISCTTINSDTNYKTISVTVSGLGDASFSTLIAAY